MLEFANQLGGLGTMRELILAVLVASLTACNGTAVTPPPIAPGVRCRSRRSSRSA
jgi:hypothetical protein